jgi:Flp pilus assembly protein TadD
VIQDLKTYLQSGRFEGLRFRASSFDAKKLTPEPLSGLSIRLALADLLAVTGKVNDASVAFGNLEATYPDDTDVLLARGQFAVRMEDFDGARQYLERAIHAGSSSARLFYDYAIVLRRFGEPDALIEETLARSVILDPRFFEGHNLLGHLQLQAGHLPQAIQHLKRAAELQPARLGVWESLAIAYHKAGEKDAAREAAKSARRVASSPEEIARIDALLDLIESDVDKIVQVPERKQRETAVAAPRLSRVQGMLSQVDCLGAQARLHVMTPERKVLLLVRDASSVRLRGLNGPNAELSCGPSAARPVIVEFQPEQHRTYGTAGTVISIEFR